MPTEPMTSFGDLLGNPFVVALLVLVVIFRMADLVIAWRRDKVLNQIAKRLSVSALCVHHRVDLDRMLDAAHERRDKKDQ